MGQSKDRIVRTVMGQSKSRIFCVKMRVSAQAVGGTGSKKQKLTDLIKAHVKIGKKWVRLVVLCFLRKNEVFENENGK